MNNNVQPRNNTSMKTAYTITNSSFDLRQGINAKVIGVLKYNNNIREKLLERNIGIYTPSNIDEGIGYISNFYSLESRKPFSLGEDGLLGHTHIYQSDYQNYINLKYGIGDSISYYQHGSLPDAKFLKWNGKYDNYLDYVSDKTSNIPYLNAAQNIFNGIQGILTNDDKTINIKNEADNLTYRSVLNDILQYDNIKYAMEKTRIGTITPNPVAAYLGSVTTNINNFNGTDTPLGLITNYLYAQSLYAGAHFNSLRKPKYITPSAYISLGNNLSTIATIGSDFRIDDETGRIIADFNKSFDEHELEKLTIDEFVRKYSFDEKDRMLASSNHARYRNLVAVYGEKPHYSPFDGDKWYEWEFVKGNTNYFNRTVTGRPEYRGYKIYSIWNEGDNNKEIYEDVNLLHGFGSFKSFQTLEKDNDLLSKTKTLFENHGNKGIDTLIGRFHTGGDRDTRHNEVGLLQSAISSFGMSHGRNLLTKKAYETNVADKINNYENPYCRTWTYHHQYDNIGNLIRPFGIENYDEYGGTTSSITSIGELQKNWHTFGRTADGAQRLNDYTVLNRNGFVNITPTSASGNETSVDIKKCMFSIENLAWKDVEKIELSSEQQGPNGGRIMWFPPYDLKFNENINVNWSNSEFIGRGEKIYTYTNTERSGTLSFTLLVDHPSILDAWKKNKTNDGLNIEKHEQTLLRFFAGCEILTCDGVKIDTKTEETPEKKPEVPQILREETNHSICFYIFFPNNYSGYDDDINKAIEMLITDYESNQEVGKEYKMDEDYKDHNLKEGNRQDMQNFKLNIWEDSSKLMEEKGYEDATMSFKTFINDCKTELTGAIIKKVEIGGYASSHGYPNSNIELTKRRCDFGKKVLDVIFKKNNLVGLESIPTKEEKHGKENIITVSIQDKENVSGDSAKLARHTKIKIYFTTTEFITEPDNASTEVSESVYLNNSSINNELVDDSISEKVDNLTNNEFSPNQSNEYTSKNINLSTKREIYGANYELEENVKNINKRWDSESEYFEMLKDNDSFLYGRIIEKIKYFTPAFHSITPEGFNARLSFLHQCTRQGPTYSVSDIDNKFKSAGNLAFGRPPICVLRIGDFYHTKIVIESVTIDYDNPQWDMNPEGIGMQPMFARISLNFKFLGGSDIEAPIARLQNAISFNYYANQSIYDDRSNKGYYENNEPKIR
jgi:hypothetical protein